MDRMGLVKNRCKNGDHYWVSAYVTPMIRNGKVIEYQSVRTTASPAQIAAAERLYAQLRAGRRPPALKRPLLNPATRLTLAGLLLPIIGALLTALLLQQPLAPLLPGSLLTGAALATLIWFSLAPLRRLAQQARQQADNPLSQYLYTGRRDDFGAIDFALQSLQAESGAIVGRINDSARQLGGEAEQLAQAVEHRRGRSRLRRSGR